MDLIKMAKEWGVKLLTLEELMSELKKLKAPPPHQSEEDMGKPNGQNKKQFKGDYFLKSRKQYLGGGNMMTLNIGDK